MNLFVHIWGESVRPSFDHDVKHRCVLKDHIIIPFEHLRHSYMSLQAGDLQLWDFSQVSSLASSLSVSRCSEKREVAMGSPIADYTGSGDFQSKIPSTALGDFTNIWKELKSEVELQGVGRSGRAGSNSQHQKEDIHDSSLREGNSSKVGEDLWERFGDVEQRNSDPFNTLGYVKEVQQTASRPCQLQKSATCLTKVKTEYTIATAASEESELKRSTKKFIKKNGRRIVSTKPNTTEYLLPCSFAFDPVGVPNNARAELPSRNSGLKLSNNTGLVTTTIKPGSSKKSLPEKTVSFVHSDSEISLQRPKSSCSVASTLSKRSSLNNRPKSFLNNRPVTRQSYKETQAAGNSSIYIQQTGICDKNGHLPLLFKLIQNFSEERKWLVKPLQLANHTCSPNGIHVFVDFSNLSIGFNNFMKMIDGIPLDIRTKFKNLSFEALVLLMERQRPVSKRVLAGSLPFVPAFEMAKAIGYELNILDKVFKAKEVKTPTRSKANKATRMADLSCPSSGSETVGKSVRAIEKWVEQGVDEILHLKILESIVDVEIPTTMVLGTGDGAVAEYSQGFFAMVERALRKGWNVELVSWSHNIGHAYKKRSFRNRWGQQFKIIELDHYATELKDI